MESFIFNNVSSDTLGLIIKEMPKIVRPEKNIQSIKVNGRNGNLHIDEGTYNSYNITINCIISENANIDTIKSTLIGTGKLKLSNVPGKYFIATIKNQIDFSKYLYVLKEFPLQLEIDPFSYSNSAESEQVSGTNEYTFTVGGNVETYPKITTYGTGTITINNVQFQVLQTGITIDCELMECTKNGINMNDSVILTEFPKLIPGTNYITLSNENQLVNIDWRNRWL